MIMAGGAGTRLWPMSRANRPKQLLPLIQRDDPAEPAPSSLLAIAAARLDGLVPPTHRYICTGERYRDQILASVPGFGDEQILGEPMGRDTVNAIALAAAVFETLDPDAVFAVLTADHLIEPADRFARAMEVGFELVRADPARLVTFAITPTHPATGFGYVKRGQPLDDSPLAFAVESFVEKPDLARATGFVESGDYGWNSGMFVFSARTFLDLLGEHVPQSLAGIRRIQQAWHTPERVAVLDEVYPTLPKVSVDYGIMEPAAKAAAPICGVTMDVSWLDIGSWPSFAQTLNADSSGNRIAPGTNAVLVESRDNLVVAQAGDEHTIAMLGCEGLVVVRTPDATLVMPADRAQDLKALYAQLPDELT